MIFDLEKLSPNRRYHLLTQSILPRPIAWVLSRNEDRSLNLAPFSFFNAICSNPPLVMLSIGHKTDGEIKDSRRNILSHRDFVIHIPSRCHAEAVNASAATLEYGASELDGLDLTLTDFPGCDIPRIDGAGVALHCALRDVHLLGPAKQAIVYAEIRQFFVDDRLLREENERHYIDAVALDPLARLGGAQFSGITEPFALKRPA